MADNLVASAFTFWLGGGDGDVFDPYHTWLSIPPGERPPTHYQILGVAADETDLEVIDQAARRQATHLRGYQNGPFAADCARLLKEVAQARATLLDPAKRKAYDAELISVESVEPALSVEEDAGTDALAELSAAATALPSQTRARATAGKRKSWLTMGVVFGALLHIIGGGLLVWFLFFRPKAKDEVPRGPKGNSAVARENGNGNIAPKQPTGKQPEVKPNPEQKPSGLVNKPLKEALPESPELPARPEQVGEIRRMGAPSGGVVALAFCPDGRRAISAGSDHVLRLWELATGKQLLQMRGHTLGITALTVSPDGRWALSTSSDATVRLWDLRNGDERRRLTLHTAPVHGVAFFPDSRRAVTASLDTTIRFWDVDDGRDIGVWSTGGIGVQLVALSSDGSLLLTSGTDGVVRILEIGAKKVRRAFTVKDTASVARQLQFAPDNRYAVISLSNGTTRLWDVETGGLGLILKASTVCYMPDGERILTAPSDNVMHLVDAKTGRELTKLPDASGPIQCLCVSPNGLYAVLGGLDGSVRLWGLPDATTVATEPMMTDPAPEPPDGPESEPAADLAPVPPATALEAAEKAIRARYKVDLAKSRPGDRSDVAEKFIQHAAAATDPAERYVYSRIARDIAVQLSSVTVACRAIDGMSKAFAVDALGEKAQALEAIVQAVSETGSRAVADSALTLMNEAADADNLQLAQRFKAVAEAAARRAKSPALEKKVATQVSELAAHENEIQGYSEAVTKLRAKPDDPDASLVAGKHLAFHNGQWKKGLALLAQCSDPELKKLATQDQARPRDTKDQVEIADGWFDQAAHETGVSKNRLLQRAQFWYETAEPRLADAGKPRIEARLKEIAKALPALAPKITPGSFYARTGELRKQLLKEGGGNERSEAAVAAGIKWLVSHQARDGHWSLDQYQLIAGCTCTGAAHQHNDVAATALALLPLLGHGDTHQGGPYAKNVESGLGFLLRHQAKDGYFGVSAYAHAMATIALCEDYGLTRDQRLRKSAIAALNYILAAQSDNGGWRYAPRQGGDTSVTGWEVLALKTGKMAGFKVPSRVWNDIGRWFDACASPDGSAYGYVSSNDGTPATTAIGLLCRMYLGWDRNHSALRAGAAQLQIYGVESERNMYFDYYATQVLFHLGGKPWDTWNAKVRDWLIDTQDKGDVIPHQAGSWSPDRDRYGLPGGRLMTTSLALLNLEVYYRHTPLYRRAAVTRKE